MCRFMQHYDLLITPTVAVPAFQLDVAGPAKIDGRDVPPQGWTPFAYIMNLTGQPAISVPAGWTEAGLPVGLQICGPHLGDALPIFTTLPVLVDAANVDSVAEFHLTRFAFNGKSKFQNVRAIALALLATILPGSQY